MLARAERARFDLIQKGRQAAMGRIDQARQDAARERKAVDEKKRRHFAELKAEMEKDLQVP